MDLQETSINAYTELFTRTKPIWKFGATQSFYDSLMRLYWFSTLAGIEMAWCSDDRLFGYWDLLSRLIYKAVIAIVKRLARDSLSLSLYIMPA